MVQLRDEAVAAGVFIRLNQEKLPGCYLHRFAVHDTAPMEERVFLCSRSEEDAGPTNRWMSPDKAYARLRPLFDGFMKGRTMYVVPHVLGVSGSPFSKVGAELTDSPHAVLNLAVVARVGQVALDQLKTEPLPALAVVVQWLRYGCRGGFGGRSGCSVPRPDGHAVFLRLQYGRLPAALARYRPGTGRPAPDIPCEPMVREMASGPPLVRISACCCGYWIAVSRKYGPSKRLSVTCPTSKVSIWTGWIWKSRRWDLVGCGFRVLENGAGYPGVL